MSIVRILFGSSGAESMAGHLLLAVVRIFTGVSMAAAHGWGKLPVSDTFIERVAAMGFPFPALFAYAAGIAECVGGIFLAAGLLTRPSAFIIGVTMAVAAFIRHADDPFSSMEKALLYAALMLVFVVLGGGKYSADRWVEGLIKGGGDAKG